LKLKQEIAEAARDQRAEPATVHQLVDGGIYSYHRLDPKRQLAVVEADETYQSSGSKVVITTAQGRQAGDEDSRQN